MAARQNNIEGFLGVVNALDVGLRGDAVKDDAATLTAILTNAKGSLVIIPPPPGTSYLLGSGVSVPANGACWVLPGVVFTGAGSLTATAGGLLIDQRAGTYVVSGVAPSFGSGVSFSGVTTVAGFAAAIVSKSASYAMTTSDGTIIAGGAAGITITLPNAPASGTEVQVKRVDATNNITVSRAGTDVIELAGVTANTRTLGSNGASIYLQYLAGKWYSVGVTGTVT